MGGGLAAILSRSVGPVWANLPGGDRAGGPGGPVALSPFAHGLGLWPRLPRPQPGPLVGHERSGAGFVGAGAVRWAGVPHGGHCFNAGGGHLGHNDRGGGGVLWRLGGWAVDAAHGFVFGLASVAPVVAADLSLSGTVAGDRGARIGDFSAGDWGDRRAELDERGAVNSG